MLNAAKWRVAKYVVQVPEKAATARPWQLQAPVPAPPPRSVGVWGVWPPQWDAELPPLLQFPPTLAGWAQALRAAADRAQFAYSPEPPSPGVQTACYPANEFSLLSTELEYPHDGTP